MRRYNNDERIHDGCLFFSRLVPLEVGRTQETEKFREKAITMEQFVVQFLLPSNRYCYQSQSQGQGQGQSQSQSQGQGQGQSQSQSQTEQNEGDENDDRSRHKYGLPASEVAYIAQHSLFDQLPGLQVSE